ncbi:alkene reductase [Leptospira ellisii]|uniref:Alkene reductase n=1 Tax=Leptospira ellisii TaxID=2023197 RepID=A0A2N0BDL6_9LEPT|nr:alkene reductase [Leptospira ellisii]MDV6234279.1 alkene reductase [Leptospira ellisii]PJZ94617.1 alkene reductase [Leptospira ellisii]PKA06269.1 alkene reductase [Leptospira ellisii]
MSTQANVSTDLFGSTRLGNLNLQNKIVMAPMTRSRALGNIPNSTMAEYYAQRAGAGLIVTEGTSPSPNGLGYARIPGLFSREQVEGWKLVTDAVHKKGGKIFAQLMHTGRASSIGNLPKGAEVLAPSAVGLSGQNWTDGEGLQPYTQPKEMSAEQIRTTISEYVQASKNAVAAGFDGVELHAANGYLLEQFLNPNSNRRTDSYGGSAENRNRFVIETAKAVAAAIGKEKTGIRISPYGVFNEMGAFDGVEEQYESLAAGLNEIGLVYVHMVDHSSQGAPEVPESVVLKIRKQFKNTLILSGGYDKVRAQSNLDDKKCELIAFGRPFIANPDFVHRLKIDAALAVADQTTFYTPGEKGYSDYPTLN